MDTPLNHTPQDTSLTMQGCGYRIENDRVIISIGRIANDRVNDNISGTLRIQLCAFSQDINRSENAVLATTTIGEIKGQHFISDGHYDLVFQQPPVGTWQFVLQLSEWDGSHYALCDTAYFEVPYQEFYTYSEENNLQADNTYLEPTSPEPLVAEPPQVEESLTPSLKTPATKDKEVKKNSAGSADGYLAINKSKVEKLLKVKGVPKKVLNKVVTERPFSSDKAVLNIKGMGPTMLKRIVESLLS
ncbi:hypothetical protein [Marinomonas transparens]|uniref:Helix-hairpin-helix domain-containing protein n=1 Tax=Marinomonas transparens TaxID=2795388 RepID=A0A934JL96_9GAMM|nr:hypothetical protein [Marinomonas transparens]MBJ7536443.1 hypothetical protein [Marinomonas transparens]